MVTVLQERVDDIRVLLERRDFRTLKARVRGLHPSDILDILRELPAEFRAVLFRLLPKDQAADVFAEMETDERQALLNELTDETVAEILEEMAPDDRTELLEEMPASVVARLVRLLTPEDRREAVTLLNYPPDSAGRIMTPDYMAVRPHLRAQQVLDLIRRTEFDKETIYYIYVIDEWRHLVGVFSLRELLLAEPSERVEQFMHRNVIAVRTTDDQESVVLLMKRYDLLAMPVVDSEDRLVGIVTIDDAMDVLEEEATEDIQKMASMGPLEESYFHTRLWTIVRKRIGWLTALLIAENVTSRVMHEYAYLLEQFLVLAFFIPVIMGAAGNVGTQSSTLVIRGLAVGEIHPRQWWRVLLRELSSGALIGLALALLMAVRILWMGETWVTAVAIGVALWAVVTIAGSIGATLPILGRLMRVDPAVMAGPLVTTIMDVLSLSLYFLTAQYFFTLWIRGP